MKRSLDDFFNKPKPEKKQKIDTGTEVTSHSTHSKYPFPIADLPFDLSQGLTGRSPKEIKNDEYGLDLLYYEPFITAPESQLFFEHLLTSLPFYHVKYSARGMQINTPRYTTVFGIDETADFGPDDQIFSKSKTIIPYSKFPRPPRPIPKALKDLKFLVESATGETFNFCLVNLYKDGKHSISYHSDDEKFLGPDPTIASLSFGATRDFLMKPKVSNDPKG